MSDRSKEVKVPKLIFGLNVSASADPGADPLAAAVRAEELGFDFVSANDHPNGTSPTHEVWTMLAWIAARTSRIKVATRVLGVPYRPPAILAKMAVTLQELSRGRLILGLGGGSSDEGLEAFGVGSLSPRAKIDALEDAIQILRGAWSQPNFVFEGHAYTARGVNIEPKPSIPIPIWLGTFGERGLALTGRLADGWIPSHGIAPPEEARVMRELVRAAAREAGREPDSLRYVYNIAIRVGDRRETEPDVVSGSPDRLAEQLLKFAQLGFDGMNFVTVGPDRDEESARLAGEVLPVLRAEMS
jgi:alkanesulfonate monooxygenase SsuD/methylene tetrahydromethanopterin reductase-like flavin-dependent oxidoreductase (luciferase family)